MSTNLVIATRAIPCAGHPELEHRLAVDTAAQVLCVVAIAAGRVTVVDHLSPDTCRKRAVLPPAPETLRGDPRKLLSGIPDSDYARLVEEYQGDVLDRIASVRTSPPPTEYQLYTIELGVEPNRSAPPLADVHITLEDRAPDVPDQPHPFRSHKQSAVVVRLAATELREMRKQDELCGARVTDETRILAALRAVKRAAEMLDNEYLTVYLGGRARAVRPVKV